MSRAVVLTSSKVTLLISATLIAGYLLGRWNQQTSRAVSTGSGDNGSGAFVLLVNMKFATLAHRDTFLQLIEPVCKDVHSNEGRGSSGTTLSYQVAISDKDPLSVVVMERYADKEYGYLTVHKSGKEFLKFRKVLQGMQERGDVTISGESYIETGLGYV